MRQLKIKFALLLLLVSANNYAQLGFCSGSKGDPIFSENFGNGTNYGPALPAGTTTYPFANGAPNDGFYTLYYHSSFFQPSWHYSLDHTPDATNGTNGKMLLVNANAATSGDFYKKVVTGLCVNTTFEFSAWLLNLYNPTSNICVNQIPINVRFEIWNASETVLLGSGNTGNIMGTPTPNWQQFALVFTTVSETSVVLKMKNNGVGGCGNDLAIDDIEFSACADLTTVSSPSVVGNTYTTCTNPTSLQLNAATASAIPYFYQWQTSTDGTTWTDIAGANNAAYTTPNLSSKAYFRVRAAQDLANLGNVFCSTTSNVFTIDVLAAPGAAVNDGDKTICSNEPIPALSVTTAAGTGVNWYNAPTGGTLLQANSASYTPTAAGTYYAETYNLTTNCIGSPRTPVVLTIIPLPDVNITGTTSLCGGNTAVVSFNGTPGAIVTYNDGVANHTITLNASGLASFTTPVLTTTTTYTLVSVASAVLSTCSRTKNNFITITVNNSATASITSNSPVCHGTSATVSFTGTANAVVTYKVNGGANQTITLNALGSASIVIPSLTALTTYTLVSVTSGGTCTQTLSQSIALSTVALPTAAISASPAVLCSNQTSTVSFNGTPNATVTYKVNSGANQTTNLNASGLASFTTPALTSDTTYTLVSVTSPVLNTCSTNINSAVTIVVNALPVASFSSNSPVCPGSSATINFTGTPNATVAYLAGSASQTVNLNAAGSASVTVPNVTASTVYTLSSVTSTGANGCMRMLSQSITISATALPTAAISANPSVVCNNQTSTINWSGTPNAVVTYKINGGANQTITLNAAGNAAFTTLPLSGSVTYQLVNVALAGCSQSLGTSAVVSVNPTPDVVYSGDLDYCDGESVGLNLASAIAGTTFNWTVVQNGTTGAIPGTGNQIAQTVTPTSNTAGTATYTVTPFNNGCAGNPVMITVTIHPLPVPGIVDGVICTTGSAPPSTQFYTLDTNLNPASHTFQWFFGGNTIPGAFGSTYDATQIGTYTVIATNAAGCVSAPVNAVVGQMPKGESLVVQQSAAFSDDPMVAITVIGGSGPFSYQLDQGAFQSSNVFQNISAGTHTITVVDEFCTNLTTTITILDYPKYFTPNGDGFHDTWNIKGVDGAVIQIFDRYGKLIKQISSNGLGWDGTYNGHLLPSTDYWFTIDYTEKEVQTTFKAHFAMKR